MYRAAAVASALLLLVSCSSDNTPPSATASSSHSAATTSTTATTTATTPTTAATTTAATVPFSPAASPSEAASTFMSAWREGNQLLAMTIAVPAAVDAVFSAGEPGSIQNRGCNEPPQPPVLCVYRTDPGEVQLRIRPEGDGWIIDQARVSPA